MKMFVAILSLLTVVAIVPEADARSRSSGGYGGTGSNPRSYYTAPYTTRNGTSVQGHHRTTPNATQRDNYGTRGNYNPWNGQTGTRQAWR